MKICFIADGNHINTLNWAGYFANVLKHEIHILSFMHDDGLELNIKHWRIDSIFRHNKLRYIASIQNVKKIIRRIAPDLVIGYRITSYGFLAAAANYYPLVLAGQGQFIVWPRNNKFKKYFAQYALKRADLIQSWAEHMTNNLIQLGANPQKILTLPKGIDTNLFKPHRNYFDDNTEKKISIISTRALKPEYKIETLIKAVCELNTKSKLRIHLKVIGTGTQHNDLVKLSRKLGIHNNINFLGHVNYNNLPDLYNQSDIYVSTVPSDGVSSSLLEAMGSGVFPIVVDNVSNQQWISDDKNGYLYKAGDVQELKSKIEKAIKNTNFRISSVLKNQLIVKEKACLHRNMRKFESAYLKIIRNKKSK